MNIVLIFCATLLILFGLAFVTRRRFGVLGLALAAGSMISSLWTVRLTPIIEHAGISVQGPPLLTIVAVVLTLMPAAVLFFSGPSYKDLPARLIGAFCFAALALALLIEPLGSALVLQGQSKLIYDFFVTNRVYIVTLGLLLALADILTTRSPKHHDSKKH